MHKLLFLIAAFILLSCNLKDNNEKAVYKPKMYKPSEMTLLMRQMYEVNKAAKLQIMNKNSVLQFPDEFLNIHSAVLTDPSERDSEFDSLAKAFISYQKETFSTNSDSARVSFNKSINACISCHETRCAGPIPKIKKLLIN